MDYRHVPVMTSEVVRYLNCRPGGIYVDCTLGGAGHARAILERILPNGLLIGIDRDKDAVENANRVLAPFAAHARIISGNFNRLPELLDEWNISEVDGILADLGLSLHHLEGSGRGFSFNRDEPLDMRMGPDADVTAGDLIRTLGADELAELFREYGEERWSKKIAHAIVCYREKEEIKSSRQLARIIEDAAPAPPPSSKNRNRGRIHPATRVFMALRIAVNKELENIASFMDETPGLLRSGGRLCVLSFHSLEDRIVKHRLRDWGKGCSCPPRFPKCVCGGKPVLRVLTRKPERPSDSEIAANPMARSTKLRAAEKL